jgi:hypothetical protein
VTGILVQFLDGTACGRYGQTRVGSPAQRKRHGGDLNPRRQGQNPTSADILGCAFGCGDLVPTGIEAKVTIRADRGVLSWSSLSGSVQSGRPKRLAPHSDPGEGLPEVNERGSRSSIVTVGPSRGGRRSYLSGFITAYRAQSRARRPAQRIHRAVAPEPKGLS